MQFTIEEREENFTLKEVLDFIDETDISEKDAHELKERICDMVDGIMVKTLDFILKEYKKKKKSFYRDVLEFESFMKSVSEEMEKKINEEF